jgi:hypothetical protein
MEKSICRDCNQEFHPYPGKPGYIDQCEDCQRDVPKVGGNMIWDHKTAPYIEVKSMKQAKQFANLQKRFGHGVTKSICESKEKGFKND